ncbi:MAG: cupin [bacterium]|nr:cupin [bacterium]
MEILKYAYEGEGLTRVFENAKWMVGIKNWKPANDITGINNLERHNETDELFILLAGRCTLLFANETADGLKIEKLEMEPLKVYNIPATLWHNTVTQKDTKLALIEDSATGSANSDVIPLTDEQIAFVRELVG